MNVLAIDGRSGAGKTTLAAALAAATGAQLVHVEHFYPGWSGLAAGAAYLTTDVLAPLCAGSIVVPRRYNWHTGVFETGEAVHPGLLVVEGCGALSRGSRPLVEVGVWIDADAEMRRNRAVARDGDDSWWEPWREQEERFYAVEHSRNLADILLPADVGLAEALAVLAAHGWPDGSPAESVAPLRNTGS